ncbi:MAG: leucine dehydrogenase [Nanoarchaeota archaeon]|nr:leucine dehydrogenase [Nanoarchaeota archaeon]MBU1974194.1 leucine dehydrogenase [Nanoarchaeota archaeon]
MIDKLRENNCNELHIQYDADSGYTFVIALNTIYHDRGNGGTRMKHYSSVEEGIEDALRLANAMTKKCVVIGDEDNGGYSGAKGVIIGDPVTQKTPEMLRSYGRFVQSLNGRFQTGCDMNISPSDLEHMAEETQYVDGLPSTGIGDGGEATAYGVIVAMKTLCEQKYGSDSLKDRVVAVQGVGSVGSDLVRRLTEEGAEVIVTDVDSDRLKYVADKYGVKSASPEEIYSVKCDIFSPNACGNVLTAENIGELNCDLVIGAANNPLSEGLESVKQMQERGIVFAPDYVVNIGAQVLAICEVEGKSFDHAYSRIQEIIQRRLHQVSLQDETMYEVAERLVHQEMLRT